MKKIATSYFAYGVIAGGLAGAAIALLYAPMKGSKLRGDIRKQSSRVMKETQEKFQKASDKVSGTMRLVRKKGDQILVNARHAGNHVAERASRAIHN